VIAEEHQGIDVPCLQISFSVLLNLSDGATQEMPGAIAAGIGSSACRAYRLLHRTSPEEKYQREFEKILQSARVETVTSMLEVTQKSVQHLILRESLGGLEHVRNLILALLHDNRERGGANAVVVGKYAMSSVAHLALFVERLFSSPDSQLVFMLAICLRILFR
jgi:hypothetical protein